MSTGNPLGLTLDLSPELAAALKEQESKRNGVTTSAIESACHNLEPLGGQQRESEKDENKDQTQEIVSLSGSEERYAENPYAEDDWDALVPLPKIKTAFDDLCDEEKEDVNSTNNEEEVEIIDEDNVSTSPPPNLPLVVVDLEKLCGYTPKSMDEARELRKQVGDALMLDEDGETSDRQETVESEALSYHFEERVGELFDASMAFHADTADDIWSDKLGFAVLPYPEFLCRGGTNEQNEKVVTTAREWKILLQPHDVPVVRRIQRHLRNCSRGLFWKIEMNHELKVLARSEQSHKQETIYESELHDWRTVRRKEQLDKLYQVRETFNHRLEVAQDKLETLRRQEGWIGDESDDESIFAHDKLSIEDTADGFETNEDGRVVISPDDFHKASPKSEESLSASGIDDNGADDDAELLSNDGLGDASIDEESYSASIEKDLIPRREAAEAEQEKEYSPQLQMAKAVVLSLETRMKQVDDLLESLQEEEWADEEAEYGMQQKETKDRKYSESRPVEGELSLLDQILAMILGVLPSHFSGAATSTTEDHYKFIQLEHESIKEEWQQVFGRLPPSLKGSPARDSSRDTAVPKDSTHRDSQSVEYVNNFPSSNQTPLSRNALKDAFGIVDNDLDDWDIDLGGDETVASPTSATAQCKGEKEKKKAVGLRPGGKVLQV